MSIVQPGSVAKKFDLMNDLSYLKDFKKPKSHALKARELTVSCVLTRCVVPFHQGADRKERRDRHEDTHIASSWENRDKKLGI